MKKLILLLPLFLAIGARGADRITATIQVTNASIADASELVVNSATRTWKTSVTTPATEIEIGADVGENTTNLWLHIIASGFSGPINPRWKDADEIELVGAIGQAMTVTATDWGTVTYSTQSVTTLQTVRVPMSAEAASVRTNIATLLVTNIQEYAQLPFDATASPFTNFVSTTADQEIYGTKDWTGTNHFVGPVFIGTATLTNGVNRGNAFSSPGLGASSEQFGIGSTATGGIALAVGAAAVASADYSVSIGNASEASAGRATAIGFGATASGTNSTALGEQASATANDAIAIGKSATVAYTNSIAIGKDATATAVNQIVLGDSVHTISVPGLIDGPTITNATYYGTVGDLNITGNQWVLGNIGLGPNGGTFPTALDKGLYLTNGTAASANPANGSALWSVGGSIQYRTSGTSEGAGGTMSLHNRSSQVVGSGTDYSLTDAAARVDFGGEDPEIVLPTAGTYLIIAEVSVTAGGTANDTYVFKLYDSTAAADITSSQRDLNNAQADKSFHVDLHVTYTVTTASTIQLYGYNSTAARGTVDSDETKLIYVRLY